MTGPEVLGLGGGQVLLRGSAVVVVWRAVAAAVAASERRDGFVVPDRLRRLQMILKSEAVAVVSACPDTDVRSEATQASSVRIAVRRSLSTAEAAVLMGKSERTIRRHVADLGGQLVAGRWLLDPDAVASAANLED